MIQTVTEAIGKDSLGAVLMHEHISCASLSYEKAFGQGWIDRKRLKALSVEALKLLKEKHRLGLMVDGTPIDLGRNALLLKEIAELSGVKIVASTGFYYLPSIETLYNDADALAKCRKGQPLKLKKAWKQLSPGDSERNPPCQQLNMPEQKIVLF